jgi:ligand-binding sensor domain-containing protein
LKETSAGEGGLPVSTKTKFVWNAILVLLVALGNTSPLLALDAQKSIAQYGHSVWVKQTGLPANAVNVALQTHDGYLWLGTSAGLFRFDGASFTEISTDPKSDGTSEIITTLCESADSSLWIGTEYSGLRCFKNGRMLRYGLKEGFRDTQVRQVLESRTGRVWIGTSIGLYMLNGRKFVPMFLNPNYITGVAEDPQGRIWIGTHEGVRIIEEASPTKAVSITTKDGLRNNVTTCIYIDRNGNIWIGTSDGLARWSNGKITNYTVDNGLSNNHINAIHEDSVGNLWVGTQKGLNRLDGNRWTAFGETDGLTDDNVVSLAEDHEGSLWVCTSDGLNQFYDVNLTTYTTYDGLASDYISSVVETPDGSLFFLSDQGANVTQLKAGKITRYDLPVGPAYVARDGSLWIGQSGLLFNIKDGRLKRYDTRNGLPSKWISAITEDDESLILYADHTGIFRFVNEHLKPYLTKDGQQYPPQEYVVCFYPQPNSALWIGTSDSLLEVKNGKFRSFTTADGLAGNWVSSIYDDKEGSLWFSSPQGGIARYRDGKFTPYNKKAGLFSNEIYCVLGDNDGDLWLSSPRGIGRVSRKELDDYAEGRAETVHSRVYMTADGMKTDECFGSWQPAGWKTHDGHLWFATRKGAVMIDPRTFKRNDLSPPVLVETVVADQKTIFDGQSVSLSPGTEKLEFHYAALSFLVPERVRFKYKLDGFDRGFVEAGTRRVAYYTNLPPGHYRFLVMACNNDGLWNETGASFGLALEPHFYQTYWFDGLMLVALGGVVFGVFRLRIRRLLKREKELETRVHEALANIKMLSGLIPICANCKKIRDDKGYWDQIEGYIQTHSEATFSHGICPDCAKKLYPEELAEKKSIMGEADL